jgi:hypothetical protein
LTVKFEELCDRGSDGSTWKSHILGRS